MIIDRALIKNLLAVVLCLGTGSAYTDILDDAFDESFALVVGIDQYQSSSWDKLDYAVKDAKAVSQFLRSQGFSVLSLYDEQATEDQLRYVLEDYFVDKVGEGDRFLFFFAGHGDTREFSNGTQGFIVPVDGTDSTSSFVSMDSLRTVAARMKDSRHQLFIMDACYGGLLAEFRGVGVVSQRHPDYLDEITRRRARQILTAGGAHQQVVDQGPGEHSLFTDHLLSSLRDAEADLNGDGYITFSELAAYIVPAASNSQQTPAVSTLAGHMAGEFLFRSPAGAAATSTIVPELEATMLGTDLDRSGILGLFEAYFEANNTVEVDRLLGLFDTVVQYFSWGETRKNAIREDKERFFRRWPAIAYTPVGEPEIVVTGDIGRISTRYDFYVQNLERCDASHGESFVELEAVKRPEGWRITSIREEVSERAKFNPC